MRWCLGHTQTIDLFVFHRYWYTSQTGIFVKRSHKLISGCTHRHGVKWGTRMASRRTFFARPFTLLTNATLRRFGFFVIVTLPIMRFPSHSIVTIFSCNRDAPVTMNSRYCRHGCQCCRYLIEKCCIVILASSLASFDCDRSRMIIVWRIDHRCFGCDIKDTLTRCSPCRGLLAMRSGMGAG